MGELTNFYTEIKQILLSARTKVRKAVNSAMVEAYWLIGKRIVEEEQQGESRAKYGDRLLENLSSELSSEFGKGFSYANLRNFRQFYLTYTDQEICYTLCSELSWSHNRLIMRIERDDARKYYLNESKIENWTVRQLERNIKSQYYQRLLSSSKATTSSIENSSKENNLDFIKDPYVLEFLQLPEQGKIKESRLEQAIINV